MLPSELKNNTQGNGYDEFPDEIQLGYFLITIPTDNRELSDEYFDSFINKVKRQFYFRNKLLSVFYTLDFEIEDITEGSQKYHTKPKLKLKKKWKKIKKSLPKKAFLIGLIWGAVIGYPDFKEGAIEIYNDVSYVVTKITDSEHDKQAPLAPKVDSCGPDESPPTRKA